MLITSCMHTILTKCTKIQSQQNCTLSSLSLTRAESCSFSVALFLFPLGWQRLDGEGGNGRWRRPMPPLHLRAPFKFLNQVVGVGPPVARANFLTSNPGWQPGKMNNDAYYNQSCTNGFDCHYHRNLVQIQTPFNIITNLNLNNTHWSWWPHFRTRDKKKLDAQRQYVVNGTLALLFV